MRAHDGISASARGSRTDRLEAEQPHGMRVDRSAPSRTSPAVPRASRGGVARQDSSSRPIESRYGNRRRHAAARGALGALGMRMPHCRDGREPIIGTSVPRPARAPANRRTPGATTRDARPGVTRRARSRALRPLVKRRSTRRSASIRIPRTLRLPTRIIPSHPASGARPRELVGQFLPIEIGLDRRPLRVREQHLADVRHIGRNAADADQLGQ
ncbi:hypothetical protein DO65_4739 [Burkholderia pseudomallei]|nr:hypothetical protein DO65_4739 [Burkholderia pseudomallei]